MKIRLTLFGVLFMCIGGFVSAQTLQTPAVPSSSTQIDTPASMTGKSVSISNPRKHRLSLIEALIQRDPRIVAAIRRLQDSKTNPGSK